MLFIEVRSSRNILFLVVFFCFVLIDNEIAVFQDIWALLCLKGFGTKARIFSGTFMIELVWAKLIEFSLSEL